MGWESMAPVLARDYVFFQAEGGIRDVGGSRGVGDVCKRQRFCLGGEWDWGGLVRFWLGGEWNWSCRVRFWLGGEWDWRGLVRFWLGGAWNWSCLVRFCLGGEWYR